MNKSNSASRKSLRGTLIASGLVVLGLLIVVAIASIPSQAVPHQAAKPVPVNVTVQPIEPVAQLADRFELTGVVHPKAIVRLAAARLARESTATEQGRQTPSVRAVPCPREARSRKARASRPAIR
jgi:hypothetical protein